MSAPRRNTSGLARDVEILELLATPEALTGTGVGVVRLAEQLGRDKAAVSRALSTLADAGIVQRDADRRTYRLGSRLYALAARTQESWLTQQARPALRTLVHNVRETTHLCVLRAGSVLTLASEPSPRMVGTASWTGGTANAWRTPSGRVLLSDRDDAAVAEWFAVYEHTEPVTSPTPPNKRTVSDLPTLLSELARIRRHGWATSDEELEQGVVAASAPVRDATGSIVAALNVSAPKSRLAGRLDDLGRLVAEHAGALSVELGTPTAY